MLTFLLPGELKRLLDAAVIAFIDRQTETFLPKPVREKIRRLSPELVVQKALDDAVQRAVIRFAQVYPDIDEDLASALLGVADFWDNAEVRKALLSLVSHPGVPRPEEREQIVAHFDAVLPERRNRERVDRAVSYLLELVAEEVWSVPGAREIREIAALQMQRLSTEAAQQQVALLKEQLHQTAQLSAGMRTVLLQLAETVEHRLLTAETAPSSPPRPRPYHNLPQPDYARFVGREHELVWLRKRLASQDRAWLMVITGIGGVGKSALAQAIAHDYRTGYEQLLPDDRFEVIVWVSAKEEVLTAQGREVAALPGLTFRTLEDIYTGIARALERDDITRALMEDQDRLVQQLLREQRMLLVIDNYESVVDKRVAVFLRNLPAPTKAIITSREWLDVADVLTLHGLSQPEAEMMIGEEMATREVHIDAHQRQRLIEYTGGLPLPIKLSVARIAGGATVDQVLRWLGDATGDLPAYCVKGQAELARSRNTSAWLLLFASTLFNRDVGATREALQQVADLSLADRDTGLEMLQHLSLVMVTESERFRLLPLVHSYMTAELNRAPDIQANLCERWIAWCSELLMTYPHDYTILRGERQNIETVLSWLGQQERFAQLSDLLRDSGDLLFAEGQWDLYLALATQIIEYSRTHTTPTLLRGILMHVVDIYAQRQQIEPWETLWATIEPMLDTTNGSLEAERLVVRSRISRKKITSKYPGSDMHATIQFHQQAAVRLETIGAPEQLLRVINSLGIIYMYDEQYQMAEATFRRALQIFSQHRGTLGTSPWWDVALSGNLALAAGRAQRYDQACDGLYAILPFLHQKIDLLEVYIALAVYEFRRGNTIKARQLGKLGEEFLAELALPTPSLPEYLDWKAMQAEWQHSDELLRQLLVK